MPCSLRKMIKGKERRNKFLFSFNGSYDNVKWKLEVSVTVLTFVNIED